MNTLMKKLFLKNLLCNLLAIISMVFLQIANAEEANKSTMANALITADATEDFLSPDVAFKLNLSGIDASNIKAAFTIAPGYYLYNKRIKFEILQPN